MRIEVKYIQTELAEKTYVRQATLSKYEHGLLALRASNLLDLSFLKKPILYFSPQPIIGYFDFVYETDRIKELRHLAAHLEDDDLKKVIAQVKAIIDFE